MTSKHPLRKSCAFCRARKIKCSNEIICEACRRQGDDCIYDFEHPRRKSRNLSVDSTASGLSPLKARRAGSRRRSCSSGSACSTPGSVYVEEVGNGEMVGVVLEGMFSKAQPVDAVLSTRYSSLLPLLTHHIVGHVLGKSNCPRADQSLTETMFDTPSTPDPLSEYGLRQRTQLIDVWYSMHPLSFLVSKTLLLRELREGTQDDILLAAMMAYAQQVIGDETCIEKGNSLFAWASSQLQTRPRNIRVDSCAGASTRVYAGIPTVQSLVLLAWNSIWTSQLRRSVCYLNLAKEMIFEIKESICRSSPPSSSRINGVDVVDVEKEIVSYLDWTTFSFSLWMSLEVGDRGTAPPSELPGTDTCSAMIQLDLVSENLSTLQKQRSVIKEIWPLTCIVGMASRIINNDFGSLGLRPNQVLFEIRNLHDQPDSVSRDLVFIFYHTFSIHLLFPKCQIQGPIISSETIEEFISSSNEILRLITVFQQPSTPFFSCTLQSLFPDAFSLALDACSCAIEYIYSCLDLDMGDSCLWQVYGDRIRVVTGMLYKASRQDNLDQGTQIRHVRKQLKACARALGSISAPATGGLPTPDLGFITFSERRISLGECAGGRTSFSYFGELPPLSSSMPSSAASLLETPIASFAQVNKPIWVLDNEMSNNLLHENTNMSAPGWCPQISVAMDFAPEPTMDFTEWDWPIPNEQVNSGYDQYNKADL